MPPTPPLPPAAVLPPVARDPPLGGAGALYGDSSVVEEQAKISHKADPNGTTARKAEPMPASCPAPPAWIARVAIPCSEIQPRRPCRIVAFVLIERATFRRLLRAHALLTGELGTTLSVRAVAEEVGLSPFHFIRQFSALYGNTPHQLRTDAKLARAKHLLATGAAVTDVCLELGFSSLGSFSSLFARRVGAPPTHYRRLVQVAVQLERCRPAPLPFAGCFGLIAHVTPRNSREA